MPRGKGKGKEQQPEAASPAAESVLIEDADAAEEQDIAGGEEREELPDSMEQQVEMLGFMLSDEEYALDILEIKEIIRLQPITIVPRTPSFLKGIITLRGVIVPIFDLRSRLGLGEVQNGSLTRIIVVYSGEEYAGLIVDSITQVMRVDANSIEPPPTTIGAVEAEHITGVTRFKERLVILLNLARVLDVTS